MAKKTVEPWEKPAPKKSRPTQLTPQSKARAKAAATKAGRKYPNLVDNMNAAKKQQGARSQEPGAIRARPPAYSATPELLTPDEQVALRIEKS
jgi:hypothetical protein